MAMVKNRYLKKYHRSTEVLFRDSVLPWLNYGGFMDFRRVLIPLFILSVTVLFSSPVRSEDKPQGPRISTGTPNRAAIMEMMERRITAAQRREAAKRAAARRAEAGFRNKNSGNPVPGEKNSSVPDRAASPSPKNIQKDGERDSSGTGSPAEQGNGEAQTITNTRPAADKAGNLDAGEKPAGAGQGDTQENANNPAPQKKDENVSAPPAPADTEIITGPPPSEPQAQTGGVNSPAPIERMEKKVTQAQRKAAAERAAARRAAGTGK
jgi:hypothetical protein